MSQCRTKSNKSKNFNNKIQNAINHMLTKTKSIVKLKNWKILPDMLQLSSQNHQWKIEKRGEVRERNDSDGDQIGGSNNFVTAG